MPRVCVILRKSYGGAYIVMDSKTMGNDVCLAWPWAELAVMGAGQAAAILQRRATATGAPGVPGRLHRAPAQPIRRRRAGLRRRRDRSRRNPPGGRRRAPDARQQARAPPPPQARQRTALTPRPVPGQPLRRTRHRPRDGPATPARSDVGPTIRGGGFFTMGHDVRHFRPITIADRSRDPQEGAGKAAPAGIRSMSSVSSIDLARSQANW